HAQGAQPRRLRPRCARCRAIPCGQTARRLHDAGHAWVRLSLRLLSPSHEAALEILEHNSWHAVNSVICARSAARKWGTSRTLICTCVMCWAKLILNSCISRPNATCGVIRYFLSSWLMTDLTLS